MVTAGAWLRQQTARAAARLHRQPLASSSWLRQQTAGAATRLHCQPLASSSWLRQQTAGAAMRLLELAVAGARGRLLTAAAWWRLTLTSQEEEARAGCVMASSSL
jgi:hypothetical protein